MNSILAYLMMSVAVYACKELYGMTPDECFAAFFWPLVFIFLRLILTRLETDGV